MTAIHGKNQLSFRKSKTDTSSSSSPTFTKDIKFAHKATSGDTQIDLEALVLPPEMPEFTNPSGTELSSANIKANQASLILVSSLRGTLICDLSYTVNTSTIIELQFSAAEGEIFTGQIRATQASSNLVDGEVYTCTGTLTAGQTDIPLGRAFNLNAFPTKQIGEVVLFIDGIQQFRSIDNDSANEGNYTELDAGGALTNTLSMNASFTEDVSWAVVSAGLIVDKSGVGFQQQLDSLAGQLDAVVPTVASLAGVPESTFRGGPNSIDLKAFADRLFQAEADIATNTSNISTKEDEFDIKWQRKNLTGNLTGSGTSADLSFSSLEVGKTYRISGQVLHASSGNINSNFQFNNGGSDLFNIVHKDTTGAEENISTINCVFTATGTDLDFNYNVASGSISVGGVLGTFVTLEELPNHTITSQWT